MLHIYMDHYKLINVYKSMAYIKIETYITMQGDASQISVYTYAYRRSYIYSPLGLDLIDTINRQI